MADAIVKVILLGKRLRAISSVNILSNGKNTSASAALDLGSVTSKTGKM